MIRGTRQVATLVPAVLAAAVIVVPLCLLLDALWPGWGLLLPLVAWWLPAPLFFLRRGQHILAARVFGFRPPSPDELAALRGPWRRARDRAAADGERAAGYQAGGRSYDLLVADSPRIATPPASGSIVTVTSAAVRDLPADQLEAVLLRDLAYHLSRNETRAVLTVVMTIPVQALGVLNKAVWRLVRRCWRGAVAWRTPAGFLGTLFVALVAVVLSLVFALPALVAGLSTGVWWLARTRGEQRADEAAVRLGAGEPLLAALETFAVEPAHAPTRIELLLRMRPAILRRAARLRQELSPREPG